MTTYCVSFIIHCILALWVYSRMNTERTTTYRVGIMFDLKCLWTWAKVNRLQDIGFVQSWQYETPASNRLLIFFVCLFVCQALHCGAFIQKHSSIITIFLSLTHSCVFVWFFFFFFFTCPTASLCFHASVDHADDTILTHLLLVGIVGESGALQI